MANKERSDLRILLLQIRETEKVRQEELESFARYSKLDLKQFDVLNVFDQPDFDTNVAQGYDALFVGGASEANVLEPETYTFVANAERLLLQCIEDEMPVFASCFGFQLAAQALGREILDDRDVYEMGTLPISLTEHAKSDVIFQGVPDGFLAVSVHQQKAMSPPEGCIELAKTDICCHAFKVIDKPFWAFQFHPEVDLEILIERLTYYKEKYTDDDGHLAEVLETAQATPESNHLIGKFVDRVLLSN
jgi:GMP synthase (glutamine-hydrolysing)